jgi:hypothetical protein
VTRASILRPLALLLSVTSAGAMFYVGLYQSRIVDRLWCPLNGKGCEIVADSSSNGISPGATPPRSRSPAVTATR